MSIIEWDNDSFLLDMEIMDTTHKEFVSLINQLSTANDDDFVTLFNKLISHTQIHFLQEQKLMIDSNFPVYAEHKDEHQRILGELNLFNKRVDKGLIAFGRNYINDRMPEWFRLHAASMDSALAAHLKANSLDVETS